MTSALFTDLYQLTMMQAYWMRGMNATATFDVFTRRLQHRNYLVSAGWGLLRDDLRALRFTDEELAWLASQPQFKPAFVDFLRDLRFTGAVYGLPEGTPFFAHTPMLVVEAPLIEAQWVETLVLNHLTYATGIASKAHRVVMAAAGRPVAEFGMRRMHGTHAPIHAARASWLVGFAATSNVEAGATLGIPVTGTMAHSYVQAVGDEAEAFAFYNALYPDTTLLLDTHDTLAATDLVIALAKRLGPDFKVRALRLDSGNLDALSREVRHRLDEAGLNAVQIIGTNSLDEHAIEALVHAGAPIDAFGVGTQLGTLSDYPALDLVYKLAEYDGRPTAKRAPDKATWPGRKAVWRSFDAHGQMLHDEVGLHDESRPGQPLLSPLMVGGELTAEGARSLSESRAYALEVLRNLPARLTALHPAEPPYPVLRSPELESMATA